MKMEIIDVDPGQIQVLESMVLDKNGRMYPIAASFYHEHVNRDVLRVFCNKHARYTVITRELLDWLTEQIASRPALEIGAGMGDLGYNLGIPMTDSYQQVEDVDTFAFMQLFRQPPTKPPSDVIKADAQNAVLRFKPKVVIGSWITQRLLHGEPIGQGNMHGPREEFILDNCDTYIFIGNESQHGKKRILERPHETFHFPWLISRSKHPEQNVIWVWNK